MRKIIFTIIFSTYFCSETLVLAQYTHTYPHTFQTYLSSGGYCPNSNYSGSIHYDTQTNRLVFCAGVNNIQYGSSVWSNATGGISYLSGKVGIGVASPTFNLDMGSGTTAQFTNNLLITNKLGINGTTINEKLEILDARLAIRSVLDDNKWEHLYSDNGNTFQINHIFSSGSPSGFAALVFESNGFVNIGGLFASSKLTVSGHGSFAGEVTSAGRGLLKNSSSAQLKFYNFSITIPNSLVVPANNCATFDFDLPLFAFTSPPTLCFSKKGNDGLSDERIIISIEGVTATAGRLRFCNISAIERIISNNEIYNLIGFGEGN